MNNNQRGVAVRVAAAFLTTLVILSLASVVGGALFSKSISIEFRLQLLAASLMMPAACLLFCIGRVGNHRFFTPEDIDGSGLTEGTARAKLLQALLQNTLEQLVLALIIYLACALTLPSHLLGVIPAAAAMFFIGRVLFYRGYAKGAPSRALGFALTFYPTIFLGGIALYVMIFEVCVNNGHEALGV